MLFLILDSFKYKLDIISRPKEDMKLSMDEFIIKLTYENIHLIITQASVEKQYKIQ